MQSASRSLLGTDLFYADAFLIPSCLPLPQAVVSRRGVQSFLPGVQGLTHLAAPPSGRSGRGATCSPWAEGLDME